MTVTRIGKLLLTLVGCIAIVTPARAQRAAAPGADEPNERADEAPNIDLASYVDRARQEFNVPGIALAVVKDGAVVFEQGFGKRNLNDGNLVDVHTGQQRMWSMITPIDIDPAPVPQLQAAQPNFLGYAEGWYLSDYRGQRLVWHDGGFPGTVSLVTLLPALRIGVVVLTNQESEDALHAITSRVLDGYLGAPRTNWIEAYAASTKLAANQVLEQRAKQAADYVPDAKPSRPLASYANTYHDRWYGDINIRLVDGELRLRFTKSPRLVGWLSAWRDDTFLVRWDDRTLNADALIDFALDQNGNVREAHMRRASPRTAHAYDYQDLDLVPKAYARTN